MTWIDLSQIDAFKFRAGYVPPDYHDVIKYAKDGRFMFPRVIEPISTNFQDAGELVRFLNTWRWYFDLQEEICDVHKYSYMPGPGEIRPTHVVFRYDTLYRPDVPAKKYVMKIVDTHAGHQEFRRQEMFYKKGFLTPKPYVFCNYFTEVEFLLKDLRKAEGMDVNTAHEISWLLTFLREIETKRRGFDELKQITVNKRLLDLIIPLIPSIKDGRKELLEKFEDDMESLADGIFDGLDFNGFFFMEFIEHTVSFEQILFDQLGGFELERESGALEVLSKRPDLPALDLIDDLISIMLRLWNMGERHNDMKGEHFLYDYVNKQWYLIDWGELVKGSIGRDLAVFLADTTTFVRDRCKFNKLYAKKTPGNGHILEKIEARIMVRMDNFWTRFLDALAEKIPTSVFSDAYKIVRDRHLTFEASKLDDYC